jgi:hypothetical protein
MYINRLPSFLSTELFADAQRRIVAMYETMDENFLPSDDYMLRFSERWLLLRRTNKQVLLVLGGEKANLASTRMVTNMTLKHLTPEVLANLELAARGTASTAKASAPAALATTTPASPVKYPMPAPAPVAAPVVAAVEAAAMAEPTRPVRMYRGKAY